MLFHSCCSVTKLCPALCDPTDWSMSGLLLFHRLSEFAQTHVPWVEDAIQPSGPLSPPTVSALNPSQHRGLFKLPYTANMISMYTVVYCGICFIVVVWNWTLNISDVCLYMYMWHAYMSIYMHVYICFNVKYAKTCVCVCVHAQSLFSWVQLFVNLWTEAHQAPLSMGFSRKEYWSGLLFPSRESFWSRDQMHISCISCTEGRFFTYEPLGRPIQNICLCTPYCLMYYIPHTFSVNLYLTNILWRSQAVY